MKVKLNLSNFDINVSPQSEINDFIDNLNTVIPIGRSGIHIKEKNKGSFTSYCGGKVTNACIQKAKNSPNKSIRKKAVFAENARAWKHLKGGLIPGVNYTSISNLFIDTDSPPQYVILEKEEPLNKFDDSLDLETFTNNKPKETVQEEVVPNWFTLLHTQPSNDNSSMNISQYLKPYLTPHLGKQGSWGNYDCSNFVTRVLKDMGYKNVGGTSRNLYAQTDRIDLKDIKEGDLVFLRGTLSSRGLRDDQASHVAIVTNTDRLNEGYIQVAQGSPGKVTSIKEWDLNRGYYKDHYLGAGRVRKGFKGFKFQFGGTISDLFIDSPEMEYNNSTLFESLDEVPLYILNRSTESNTEEIKVPDWFTSRKESSKKSSVNNTKYSGERYNFFKQQFNNYLQIDPDAAKYEKVLTDIAKHESNFNFSIQNTAGAPAYGCFLFWQDGKINNISKFSGLSVDEFRNNPQAQIAAAVKMARSIENQFNSEDLRIASSKGYSMDALIRGAWLGGVGGVRKVLRGIGNPSDNKWYNGKGGRSVKQAMDEQNNLI